MKHPEHWVRDQREMKVKNFAVVTMLVACMFVVGGCGCGKREPLSERMARGMAEKMMEKAIEKDGGGKASVDLKNNKFTVKTDKGEVSIAGGDGVALPKDFPSDVYVDKDAKVQSVMNAGTGMTVSMLSKSSVAAAAEVYQQKMTGSGWKQDTQMTMPEQVYTVFKKENRQALVTIAKSGEGTIIALSLTKEGGEESK